MLSNDRNERLSPSGGSFLSGPTLYLRGIELGDAASMASWYPSPFPAPTEIAEERLLDEVPLSSHRGTHRFVACRLSDERQVGSVEFSVYEGVNSWLSVYADPLLGAQSGAIRAELLEIMIPWLQLEKDLIAIWIEIPKGDLPTESAATRMGMRAAYRFRECCFFNGQRTDLICYEILHPKWIERFGLPELAPEGNPISNPKSPAPVEWNRPTGYLPMNAFAAGNRLYLRPIERGDAEEIARWSTREMELSHDLSRHLRSPVSDWTWNRRNASGNGNEWIRFAIVTLDDHTVIGSEGITDIDWIAGSGETEIVISRPEFRGAGYGTEAKHLLLEYAFERLGLHMIKTYVWKFNQRSAAALTNQGYRQAGGLSWTGMKNAEFVDDIVFDILADEWREHRRLGKR